MATKPVPSLTLAGWKKEIREKADTLIAYFFYSDASQSNIYLGNITSLPKIIEQYGNEEDTIRSEMEEQMSRYLQRYFDVVEVDVSVNIPENANDNRMEIICKVVVGENGVKYDLSKLLKTSNGKVIEIIDRNNSGSL